MHHEVFRNGRATTPSPRCAPEKAPKARTAARPCVTGSTRAEGITPGPFRGTDAVAGASSRTLVRSDLLSVTIARTISRSSLWESMHAV
jgi:hypothetical protein